MRKAKANKRIHDKNQGAVPADLSGLPGKKKKVKRSPIKSARGNIMPKDRAIPATAGGRKRTNSYTSRQRVSTTLRKRVVSKNRRERDNDAFTSKKLYHGLSTIATPYTSGKEEGIYGINRIADN